MGAVYECVHLTTGKHCALKVMLPQIIAAPGMRERFELEARVTSAVESDHIVETFDAGIDAASGAPFLVMELLRGDDLETVLASRGPYRAPEAVALLSQVALALDRTHAAGIVHRDLKPQNLFLTTRDDGSPCVKILDFGIAKVVADGTKTVQRTAALGTPIYMSPEQTTGDGTIGPAADLYSLAHIAFALLVGSPYWSDEQRALTIFGFVTKMVAGPTEPPSVRAARAGVALPAAFDAWFAKAAARSPADRFARASTQIAELATAIGVSPPPQLFAPPPPPRRVATPARGWTTPLSASQPVSGASGASGVQAGTGPAGGGADRAVLTDPRPPRALPSSGLLLAVALAGVLLGGGGIFLVSRQKGGAPDGATLGHDGGDPQTPGPAGASAGTASTPTAAPAPVVAHPPVAATSGSAVIVDPVSAATMTPASSTKVVGPARPKSVESTKAAATAPAPIPSPARNCDPPYVVDAAGHHHAKPECL
jgi:serine/threonine-protein kinase